MVDRVLSRKTVDTDKSKIIVSGINIHPNPADFVMFLPWACKEYGVNAEVVFTRSVQSVYATASSMQKKYGLKQRLSKRQSLLSQDRISNVENQSSEAIKLDLPVTANIVNIETVYDSYENLVELKFLKNTNIPRKFMQVLALTIPYQQHLTSITINSGLFVDTLYEMSKCLPDSQITEICLDGTFLNQANYHILLTPTKLKHLSLARCTINDDVVKTITDQLKEPCPAARVLSVLNLSTNRITDIGAKYFADILRINRQLCYLNLAGNMITDDGGVSILNTLQKFRLQPKELLESRSRCIAYLKKRNDLINTLSTDPQTATIDKNDRKRSSKRPRLENTVDAAIQQHFESAAAEAQRIQEIADSQLGLFNDAFSPNNTETQGGVVHCFGNNTLCYLNLAYNNLTLLSIKKLLEVLTTQNTLNRTPRGLIKVVVEGNLIPEVCDEFKEINNLLSFIRTRQSENTKRKPLSSKSIR